MVLCRITLVVCLIAVEEALIRDRIKAVFLSLKRIRFNDTLFLIKRMRFIRKRDNIIFEIFMILTKININGIVFE